MNRTQGGWDRSFSFPCLAVRSRNVAHGHDFINLDHSDYQLIGNTAFPHLRNIVARVRGIGANPHVFRKTVYIARSFDPEHCHVAVWRASATACANVWEWRLFAVATHLQKALALPSGYTGVTTVPRDHLLFYLQRHLHRHYLPNVK
jgi:hypothetical protein